MLLPPFGKTHTSSSTFSHDSPIPAAKHPLLAGSAVGGYETRSNLHVLDISLVAQGSTAQLHPAAMEYICVQAINLSLVACMWAMACKYTPSYSSVSSLSPSRLPNISSYSHQARRNIVGYGIGILSTSSEHHLELHIETYMDEYSLQPTTF